MEVQCNGKVPVSSYKYSNSVDVDRHVDSCGIITLFSFIRPRTLNQLVNVYLLHLIES